MIIKSSQTENTRNLLRSLWRRRRRRWLISACLSCALIILIALPSFYFGMFIKTEDSLRSFTFRSWGLSLLRHKLGFIPNHLKSYFATCERIDIDVKYIDFQQLAFQRKLALEHGSAYRIHPENRGYVPAKIRYNGDSYRVKIKLKGGQSDHWADEERWSFKIELKDGKTIMGMSNFALQHPWTRSFMNEWLLHELLREHDLIALRYDFIDLTLNGRHLGIYALEENMGKALIENNRRREGPIVHYNTDVIWSGVSDVSAYFHNSDITAYESEKISNNPTLRPQFEQARNLLECFRTGRLATHQVFDIDKMAEFMAIIDLTGHHHASELYNLKFYYNPITSLLEPIGYDNQYILALKQEGLLGANRKIGPIDTEAKEAWQWHARLFADREFYNRYISALDSIADREKLDDFFTRIDSEFQNKINILHKSYPWYYFENKAVLYDNISYIRKVLDSTKNLQAYLKSSAPTSGHIDLEIGNICDIPLEVTGLTLGPHGPFRPQREITLQPGASGRPVDYCTVCFALPANLTSDDPNLANMEVRYRFPGAARFKTDTVHPWPRLDETFVKNDLIRQKPNHDQFDFLTVDAANHTITINNQSSVITINRNVILPAGYRVICPAGTTLNLTDSACILSFAALVFLGTSERPILIRSSDHTGQGLVVMKAQAPSTLQYVHFDNLCYPRQFDWELTGAVNFYESTVCISHSQFTGNHSEDGLNIIRSTFRLEHSLFENTFGDALDADFCQGHIVHTNFLDCGNDAIDVSGSEIQLHHILIDRAGDKGISAGERSRIDGQMVAVLHSEIALAGKDTSGIMINNVEIADCRIGITAFQKKSEYGPAFIRIHDLKNNSSTIPYLVEERSVVWVEGKKISPDRKNVKDILYGVEYGNSSKQLPL